MHKLFRQCFSAHQVSLLLHRFFFGKPEAIPIEACFPHIFQIVRSLRQPSPGKAEGFQIVSRSKRLIGDAHAAPALGLTYSVTLISTTPADPASHPLSPAPGCTCVSALRLSLRSRLDFELANCACGKRGAFVRLLKKYFNRFVQLRVAIPLRLPPTIYSPRSLATGKFTLAGHEIIRFKIVNSF